MSFSRSFLKSIGLNEEQVSAVMEEHTAVTTALKGQRDQFEGDANKYKADAEKLGAVQKELETLKARKDYEADFNRVTKELADYKAQVAKDAETAKVKAAYKQLLADEKISEKRHDAIMKLTDFSAMKLDADGKLENADKLKEAIGKDWGEFRVSTRQRGEDVAHPPKIDNGQPMGDIRKMTAQWHAERYGSAPTENK